MTICTTCTVWNIPTTKSNLMRYGYTTEQDERQFRAKKLESLAGLDRTAA